MNHLGKQLLDEHKFEPYVPTAKDLQRIQEWQKGLTQKQSKEVARRVAALKKGEYYDVIKVARHLGYKGFLASTILNTLAISGVIKRTEFYHLKSRLVHKSDLPVFVAVLEKYLKMRNNWLCVMEIANRAFD